MRLRLVHTLSLLLLACVLLSVLSMGAVTAWNLRSGFTDYLAARDVERLEQFAEMVAQLAGQDGGAERLVQGRLDMHALLDQFAQRQGLVVRPPGAQDDGLPDRPRPPGPPGPIGRVPPREGPEGFGARVSVLGSDGQALAGDPRPAPDGPFVDRPIRLNGKVLALARLRLGSRVPDAVDTRFLRSQYLGILGVATALLLLALAGAWLVARRWVRPLQAVQDATARIARGEFDVRVGSDRPGIARSDEIGDVERNVNRMAEGLQRLEGSRRRWLADISHELRTPLTVLRGEIEALLDGVRPLERAALVSLREDAMRLGTLIDDLHLLAMSDLQSLPCHFVQRDAVALLEKTTRRFAERAAASGLELDVTVRCAPVLEVCWDPARIDQLLVNLLENSLRYTDAPGRIMLELNSDGTQVTINLDDSAPGVPASDLVRVFEPLYRLDAARSRHRGGSGLGLAICEAIVRSHGGSIKAGASALGGLRMRIELPVNAGAA